MLLCGTMCVAHGAILDARECPQFRVFNFSFLIFDFDNV